MSFNWTDKKVVEFTRSATKGPYGLYEGLHSIEDKLNAFKTKPVVKREKNPNPKELKPKTSRMNPDGSRTYKDSEGMLWDVKKESLPKIRGEYKYYTAEQQGGDLCTKMNSYKELINDIEFRIKIKKSKLLVTDSYKLNLD